MYGYIHTYIPLHTITLHCTTLHYITYRQTNIHTYISTCIYNII